MKNAMAIPSFLDDATPVGWPKMEAWLKTVEAETVVGDIPALCPGDTPRQLEQFYIRARLLALLSGRLAPMTDEQAAFLAAFEAGQPVALLDVEPAPTLRKAGGSWRWQVGRRWGRAAELLEAMRQYENAAAEVIGV